MIKMRPLLGLLELLLFLCLVHSCTGDTGSKTVVVFKRGEKKVLYKRENGETKERTPRVFCVPAFVGGMFKNKEFLAIISSARFFHSSRGALVDGAVRTSYEDHNIWSAAEGFTNAIEGNKVYRFGEDFTAVMKNDKIYVLATGYYDKAASLPNGLAESVWDHLMFVGTVGDSAGSAEGGASITWEKGKSFQSKLAEELQSAQATRFVGGVGNGLLTQNGAIVFPIYLHQQDGERTSSILYSEDDGATWKIGRKTEDDTYGGSVVEWGDGKLLLIVRSNKGYRRVFESGDMGTTWEESLVFSGVWGGEPTRTFSPKQGSAIKVTVDEKDMLLFAHPLTAKGGSSPDTLQLWLSDGQRIVRVGTISDEEKEVNTGNSILAHVGDHLYITHVINPDGIRDLSSTAQDFDQVIGFTPLPKFFASAKTTVRAWRKLDEWFVSKDVPTEGLVGFLKNTKKDDLQWDDMYKCVDATVNGGESVDGGFRFSGAPESRAEWPVSSQGQNQVYIFANKQFTLSATVTIHTSKKTGEFSLLGASLDSQGTTVLLSLGYTHDNKWKAVSGDKESTTTTGFEREKEYHVELTFANGAAAVYVDGVDITEGKMTSTGSPSISHFFLGGTGQPSPAAAGSACTVRNVMLFNRDLKKADIDKLTKVSEEGKLNEPLPKTESKEKPEGDTKVPTKESEGDKKEPTKESGGDKKVPTKESQGDKKEPTKESGGDKKEPTKESQGDKKVPTKEGGSGKGEKKTSVTKTGANDGAVVSGSFLAWISLVCSVAALSLF